MALVAAHRGASRLAPANSMEAFEAAIRVGADMVELDVRRTLDGQYVVFHDEALRGRPVSRFTYAEIAAIRQRGATRSLHGRLDGGFAPPLLEAVVERLQGRIGLDVELKETGYEAAVQKIVMAAFGGDQLVFSSFHDSALAALRRLTQDAHLALLIDPALPAIRSRFQGSAMLSRASRCGADMLAPFHRDLDAALLERAASRSVGLVVWTVNSRRRLQELLPDPRVTVVISDIPDVAAQILASAPDQAQPESPTGSN